MKNAQAENCTRHNQLLNAFEPASLSRILPRLEPVTMKLGAVVCEAGALLQHAYFPSGCVLSLLTVLESGDAIETSNIGREGAFGLFAAMYSRVSFNRCIVKLEGPMDRLKIDYLEDEFNRSSQIRNLLVSYSETLLSQVQQTVACNSMHTVGERMCRWLLMMDDRAQGESLTFTHEFLADIMGVNRKSISVAAYVLQRLGLIEYRRGLMQVLDREGLERASCECYDIVKARFQAFLVPPISAVQDTASRRVLPDDAMTQCLR
jgi:CRP-like cAMP-binding protein